MVHVPSVGKVISSYGTEHAESFQRFSWLSEVVEVEGRAAVAARPRERDTDVRVWRCIVGVVT